LQELLLKGGSTFGVKENGVGKSKQLLFFAAFQFRQEAHTPKENVQLFFLLSPFYLPSVLG